MIGGPPSAQPTVESASSGATPADGDLLAVRAREEVRAKLFGSTPATIHVGRFALLEEIGSGGMGTVFAAYDPQLDRKVAVKVLTDPHPSPQKRARMIREAQAMARLAHPNVVSVFDAGMHEGRVFIAMEFIDGQTLGRWLGERTRSQPEIVGAFVQAGRGLAAAHAANLVHRDFKPHNVLVDRSGRVRVLDFGLARAGVSSTGEDTASAQALAEARADAGADGGEPLTRTGAVLGTPAYMAPEQHMGGPVDARSDQFGFCVALYEGLYGERPFRGSTLAELVMRICDGEISAPPPESRVPRALRALVLRGLSVRPDDRHPDMGALLRGLERYEARSRRRWWLLAATIALGSAATGGWSVSRSAGPSCDGARERAAVVWGTGRRAHLQAAVEGVDLPYAKDTAAAITRSVDGWITAWSAMHTETCEATHVRGEQSVLALDLRMECLTERLREVDATLSVLEEPDPEIVEHAAAVVADFPGLSRCADLEALREEIAPPEDAEVRAAVEEARLDLVRARTMVRAEKFEDALAVLEPLEKASKALGYVPLQAEVAYALGDARFEAGAAEAGREALLEAYWLARANMHDRLAARAAIRIAFVVGAAEARAEEGLSWARHAEVELARRAEDLELSSQLANVRGAIHFAHQDFEQARGAFEEGLRLRERWSGPGDPTVATGLVNLGTLAGILGDHATAEADYRRALELRLKSVGPSHPSTANARQGYARVLVQAGRYREAQVQLEAALVALRGRFAGDHPGVAEVLAGLGNALRNLGEYSAARARLQEALAMERRLRGSDALEVAWTLSDLALAVHGSGELERARALHEEALAILRVRLGDRHDNVASVLINIGLLALAEERPELAEPYFREAYEIHVEIFGADSLKVATSLDGLAETARVRGRVEQALELAGRAVELRERSDPEHPALISSLTTLGRAELAAGQASIAIEHLERALAIHEAREGELDGLAEARFALAEALTQAGRDEARARSLADSARAWFASAGGLYAPRVRAIDAWRRG